MQNVDSLQQGRLGDHAIRARAGLGIGSGWDPGPPVWDPGTPIDVSQTQRQPITLAFEEVEINRYPKAQTRCLASLKSPSDKSQGEARGGNNSVPTADQLKQHQSMQGKGRQLPHKTQEIQTSPPTRDCTGTTTRLHGIEWQASGQSVWIHWRQEQTQQTLTRPTEERVQRLQ